MKNCRFTVAAKNKMGGGGRREAAKHRGSDLAFHPADPGLILGILINFFRCCQHLSTALVREKRTEAIKC